MLIDGIHILVKITQVLRICILSICNICAVSAGSVVLCRRETVAADWVGSPFMVRTAAKTAFCVYRYL
jgi:hypothetical protein